MSATNPKRIIDATGSEPGAAVRRFYEALNTGDTALVDQALAPGWEAVPALRTGPGSEGWKASISPGRPLRKYSPVSRRCRRSNAPRSRPISATPSASWSPTQADFITGQIIHVDGGMTRSGA